jgi:hypothetical protein
MTNRGQAFVEMALVSGIAMLVFSGILTTLYWLGLRVYSSHYLYESLVCNLHSTTTNCEKFLESKIMKFPLVQKVQIHFYKKDSQKSYQIKAHLQITNEFCKVCETLEIKDSIYVPKTYR